MNLTHHANKRIRQRGFKKAHLDLLLQYGDLTRKPGDVMEVRITNKEISRIIHELNKLKRQLSNIKNKAILIDPTNNTIVTAYNVN